MEDGSLEVQSPGYPEPYEHRRDCIWTITTRIGRRLEMIVQDAHVGTRYPWRQICEGGSLEVSLENFERMFNLFSSVDIYI